MGAGFCRVALRGTGGRRLGGILLRFTAGLCLGVALSGAGRALVGLGLAGSAMGMRGAAVGMPGPVGVRGRRCVAMRLRRMRAWFGFVFRRGLLSVVGGLRQFGRRPVTGVGGTGWIGGSCLLALAPPGSRLLAAGV